MKREGACSFNNREAFMKAANQLIIFFSLCASIIPAGAMSQSFTRITAGAIVNDVAASRSVNWVDVNNDGFLDLFVSTGREGGENDLLYINNGPDSNFSFRKVTDSPIVQDNLPSDGSSWADFDNDGQIDAAVVAWYDSLNSFYRNTGGGVFTSLSSSPIVTDRGYSETCTWGDYDNDGYVDLYVTNSGGNLRNALYHNNGNGTFTRMVTGSPVTDQFPSRGANWVDYDDDGDVDLFVANESNRANNLYKNELKETGSATFTRITAGGIVTDITSSWSGSWGDYDNDGDLDVFVATGYPLAANDMLYNNNGDGTFTRILTGPVVTEGSRSACGAWGDVDNDGDLDLFVTTAYNTAATRNFLYRNQLMQTGNATFTKDTSGSIVTDADFAYGCAWGDYDNDGDLDMFVANTRNEAATNALYRNDNTNGNHWFEMKFKGTTSNRSGIGAKVRLTCTINGQTVRQLREVDGQSGYCGQNLVQHFGVGDATVIDSVVVDWPSGTRDVHRNVAVDRIMTATEGGALTTAHNRSELLIRDFRLGQNYPNPFNPTTRITYSIGERSRVQLTVFDLLGREVRSLVNDWRDAGEHSISFDAGVLASGVYFYSLRSGEHLESKRMIVLR
jgi:enediyne biosynthesis protein E4